MEGTGVDVDVVVVGSGAAGLVAALTTNELGARRVLVAEAETVVGGSSRLSGGLILGAGTRYQIAAGVVDSADDLFHDYMQMNRWVVDAATVRSFCEMSGPVVEWLGDLGVEYHDELVKAGDERTARVHVPVGNGQAVIDVLHRRCRERGVDIALGQRVDRLITRDDGTVAGVAAGDDEITAHAVVLATGGFGNSREKLARHFPSAAATEWTWYIGGDGARGDAIDLGGQVGAQLVGHDHGLRLLHVDFDRNYEALLPGWLMMVVAVLAAIVAFFVMIVFGMGNSMVRRGGGWNPTGGGGGGWGGGGGGSSGGFSGGGGSFGGGGASGNW